MYTCSDTTCWCDTSTADITRLIDMEHLVCMHVGTCASVSNPMKTETMWQHFYVQWSSISDKRSLFFAGFQTSPTCPTFSDLNLYPWLFLGRGALYLLQKKTLVCYLEIWHVILWILPLGFVTSWKCSVSWKKNIDCTSEPLYLCDIRKI